MGKTFKIVMIRHGESEWNKENRFCGWFDAGLSEVGMKEVRDSNQSEVCVFALFPSIHDRLLLLARL